MSSAWYVNRDGRIIGPISWNELQKAAKSGKLRPTDPVRPEHDLNWRKAADARDLPTPQSPPPPATMPEVVARESVPEPGSPEPVCAKPSASLPTPLAEAATATPVEVRVSARTAPPATTGRSFLALLVAILGLFGFGLLCGGLAVSIAGSNVRRTRGIGRGLAMAALLLGLAEVGLMLLTVANNTAAFWRGAR